MVENNRQPTKRDRHRLRWFFDRDPIIEIDGNGARMHIGSRITDAIVFMGFPDPEAPSGMRFEGTGFLLAYDNDAYLVTARHVAKNLYDLPFQIRANRRGEKTSNTIDVDGIKWKYHPDETVDIAVYPININRLGCAASYLKGSEFLVTQNDFDVGDICYTIGMFHFMSGVNRNLPIVYVGNVSLMPSREERVKFGDGKDAEAYLVESRAINGASGGPVFVRPSFIVEDFPDGLKVPGVTVPRSDYRLLGVFVGSWFIKPDETVAKISRIRSQDIVPVGLGIVAPAYNLIEILESDDLAHARSVSRAWGAATRTGG